MMLRKKYLIRGGIALVALVVALLLTALWSGTSIRPAPAIVPGYTTVMLNVAHRDRPIALHIWYPSETKTKPELLAQNALFYGTWMRRDARALTRPAPVVLLSHGSGGNAQRMGWLATELAAAGMMVVAVNHPGTTSGDSDPFLTVKIWERPKDLSAALDFIGGKAPLGMVPDMSRVAVLGFSLGGFSALSLSGVQVTKAAFIDYCSKNQGLWDCGWMSAAGVDFSKIDQSRYEASNLDSRITATVAIDPALPAAMTVQSLVKLRHPVLIINQGSPSYLPPSFRADKVAAQIQGGRYHVIPGAQHFSFLAECSGLGWAVIRAAGDDNICSDIGFRARSEVHAEALGQILPFLQTAFGLPKLELASTTAGVKP